MHGLKSLKTVYLISPPFKKLLLVMSFAYPLLVKIAQKEVL